MNAAIDRSKGPYPMAKIGGWGSFLNLSKAKFSSCSDVAKMYIDCRAWDRADKELDSLKNLLWSPNPVNRPEYSTLHHLRGLLSFGRHDYKEAIKELVKSTEIDPANFEVRYELAKAYEMSGQKKKAMDIFKQIAAYSDSEARYQRLLKEPK